MGDAARHLLQSFEALSETERREVLEELLRRAADHVFQDLDRCEASG